MLRSLNRPLTVSYRSHKDGLTFVCYGKSEKGVIATGSSESRGCGPFWVNGETSHSPILQSTAVVATRRVGHVRVARHVVKQRRGTSEHMSEATDTGSVGIVTSHLSPQWGRCALLPPPHHRNASPQLVVHFPRQPDDASLPPVAAGIGPMRFVKAALPELADVGRIPAAHPRRVNASRHATNARHAALMRAISSRTSPSPGSGSGSGSGATPSW